MKDSLFFKQADLLLRVLPHVALDSDLVLHGGTAINFFVRDLPRLSVDIDLTFLPVNPREDFLSQLSKKLKELAKRIHSSIPGVRIEEKEGEKKRIMKLLINQQGALIKIEPNQVIRGAVFPPEERDLSKRAQEIFEKFVTIKTLSFAELYGGKICAALDRQHPRDLFDIKLLFENEGITDEVRKAFLVYLISHRRPIHELLDPKLQEMRQVYEKEFIGMTLLPVQYQELEDTRQKLIDRIKRELTEPERRFLLSFKRGEPKWELIGLDEKISALPAVQWKLENLRKMDTKKHVEAVRKLEQILKTPKA